MADFFVEAGQSLAAGQKGFCQQAFGPDHLMDVEEHVEIDDFVALDGADADPVHKILGRDQHLILAKHQLGHVVGHKNAVLWRQDKTIMPTQRAGFDDNWGEVAACGDGPPPDPADRLQPVIAGLDQVALGQQLDRDVATRRPDQCAGGKTGNRGDRDKGGVRQGLRHRWRYR